MATITLRVKKSSIMQPKINPCGSHWYTEVLWSETISLCKKYYLQHYNQQYNKPLIFVNYCFKPVVWEFNVLIRIHLNLDGWVLISFGICLSSTVLSLKGCLKFSRKTRKIDDWKNNTSITLSHAFNPIYLPISSILKACSVKLKDTYK